VFDKTYYETYERLYEYISGLQIIDTHEHLPAYENERNKNTDVLREYLIHYMNSDLLSSGMGRENLNKVRDITKPVEERWKIMKPFWECTKHTGYARILTKSVKGLYGMDGINNNTIVELNEKFKATLDSNQYDYVLKKKSKIARSILVTVKPHYDKEYFFQSAIIDYLINPSSRDDIIYLQEESDIGIKNFTDWLEAVKKVLIKTIKNGAVSFKVGLAYLRSLKFERTTYHEAENDFNKIFNYFRYPIWEKPPIALGKHFQNYLMHYFLSVISEYNMIVQFHTGLQEGSGNYITDSDPSLLINLFLEYPEVNFDIFHIGYPYQHVTGTLCKNFPNVYVDMCFAHMISPVASINALDEWINCIPINKISAFGGDYGFIDGVYGHQLVTRENIAKVLSKKILEGILGFDDACEISKKFLFDNPYRIFKLEGRI
jgi:uncharacterized protein